ncbi:hypothetical protein [Mycolicibacterium sphagni]|uniref:Uncharacterized protein n=1 Tax=Mycolicibacterium sphagni TaxID=1786 RepID=A0A255DHX4_9MYCO|nr:hypothetical protein [Mycolicibacterium sphagni]OYN76835.1 hypothetical protein CG716_20185 [Mycolicibacterium sphagni]
MSEQTELPLWERKHDLPPRWDGMPVEWGEWTAESMLLHRNDAPAAFLSAAGCVRHLVKGKPTAYPMSRGDDITIRRVGKRQAGRQLDRRTWDEYPEAVTI